MITKAEYDYPLTIAGGFFNGRVVPPFIDYMNNYHIHFLRYMYYMCVLNATEQYPFEIKIDEIKRALLESKSSKCKPRIKKILIGEAPPPKPNNYFYDPHSPWTAAGRPGVGGTAWSGAIQTALFPGMAFPTKVDFLVACAQEGFVLLDLFPYAITYGAKSKRYTNALISAFGSGGYPYPYSLMNQLSYFKCCFEKDVSIGFGLKRIGNPILSSASCVTDFTIWSTSNSIILNPLGAIDLLRTSPAPVANSSAFLRVCGRNGLFGPCPILLNVVM